MTFVKSMQSHIGYKKCGNYIIKLEILVGDNENAYYISNKKYATFTASCAKILSINNKDSGQEINEIKICSAICKKDEIINSTRFIIEYFLSEEPAYSYDDTFKNGILRKWYHDGQISEESNYIDGKLNGNYKKWYMNGTLSEESNYINGKLNGPCKKFYENVKLNSSNKFINYITNKLNLNNVIKILVQSNYTNGKLDGMYNVWYENGKIAKESNYLNGNLHGVYKNGTTTEKLQKN